MDIMDIMDIRDIMDIINIMDIMDIVDMMVIMIITAWMAMAGAVSALVLFFESPTRFSLAPLVASAHRLINVASLYQRCHTKKPLQPHPVYTHTAKKKVSTALIS